MDTVIEARILESMASGAGGSALLLLVAFFGFLLWRKSNANAAAIQVTQTQQAGTPLFGSNGKTRSAPCAVELKEVLQELRDVLRDLRSSMHVDSKQMEKMIDKVDRTHMSMTVIRDRLGRNGAHSDMDVDA